MIPTTNERLARLETHLEHIGKRLDAHSEKIDDVHEYVTKQKGGWFTLVTSLSAAGVVGGLVSRFLPN